MSRQRFEPGHLLNRNQAVPEIQMGDLLNMTQQRSHSCLCVAEDILCGALERKAAAPNTMVYRSVWVVTLVISMLALCSEENI